MAPVSTEICGEPCEFGVIASAATSVLVIDVTLAIVWATFGLEGTMFVVEESVGEVWDFLSPVEGAAEVDESVVEVEPIVDDMLETLDATNAFTVDETIGTNKELIEIETTGLELSVVVTSAVLATVNDVSCAGDWETDAEVLEEIAGQFKTTANAR
ncbi:hypothetical protein BC830DRAFT_1082207 [Chytriomyces sp. MP71]|nr:hypothetical protein BC830DRAFT_1082207 [Chytriomyces sp. MP71]